MSSSLRASYEVLVELPADQRADWLQRHCADADQRRLLAQMLAIGDLAQTNPLGAPAPERLERLEKDGARAENDCERWVGQQVGPFRLLRLIGQGGMGAIYLARRESADFDQQVAVKLLRRGWFSQIEQRLFRRERQLLASLSHPNIARLVDGGVTDAGLPYLAMEFIEGVAITRYCVDHHLDLRARLRLLLTVCRAVDAAHHALIVHRDIKPSNILVTADGTAKLLDFGVAKLLEGEEPDTATGLAALTPDYAAPEQFSGAAITTATDVYALGILLHELLTGSRPVGQPLRRPSASAAVPTEDRLEILFSPASLRGDLDNIVLKSLEVEPHRRYTSAGALGDDIERHLNGQPVAAHPPSRWYRTRKFVQRHRGGVGIAMLMLIAVVFSLATALWQTRVARDEARRANAVRDLMVQILRETAPTGPAAERPEVPELVYQATARLMDSLVDQPEVRAELQNTLGNVLRHMNELPRSEALLLESEKATATLPGNSKLRVENQIELTRTLMRKGDYAGASSRLDPLLTIRPTELPDGVPLAMLLKLAMVLAANRADTDRAVQLGEEMIQSYRADCARGLRCAESAMAINDFASVLVGAGKLLRARALFVEALALKRMFNAPLASVADSLAMLAVTDQYLGDLDQAQRWADETDVLNNSLELDRPRLSNLQQRAEIALARESAEVAETLLRELIKAQDAQEYGPCSQASARLFLARALLQQQSAESALAESQRMIASIPDCSGSRLFNGELGQLVAARAELLRGAKAAAESLLGKALESAAQLQRSGPNRKMLFLADSMRVHLGLGKEEAAQADARSLLAYLDEIGAIDLAPWRLEAEIVLLDREDSRAVHALHARISRVSHWPIGQRLLARLESRQVIPGKPAPR